MDSSKHILIIDDDPILAEMLKSYFYDRGIEKCTVETNGLSAINAVDQLKGTLALITCDLNMAECDGVEFLGLLKERDCKVPIVIITAATKVVAKSADLLAKAHGLNYLGLVEKPLDVAKLNEVLAPLNFSTT